MFDKELLINLTFQKLLQISFAPIFSPLNHFIYSKPSFTFNCPSNGSKLAKTALTVVNKKYIDYYKKHLNSMIIEYRSFDLILI